MAAINFCIRRHNRGQTQFTREAFLLYKEALERGFLLENGILPKYTYINIGNLAHLSGASDWAFDFLKSHKAHLTEKERANTFAYALAGHYFRQSKYSKVLELLHTIQFTEVFIQLDVRKMLLRSYFELGEWQALDSLLLSFQRFLRRQKNLGYHRESYLNLVRFTKRLVRAHQGTKRQRAALRNRIEAEESVAERAWLLEHL